MKIKLFITISLCSLVLHAQAIYSQAENKIFISPVESGLGKDISIPVYMTNADEIVAIQLQVRFPEGMIVPSEAEMSDRKDNHTISVKSLGNNEYLYAIYSITNKPLRGNSGILFRLSAKVPEDWEVNSVHSMVFVTTILSKANGDNVVTSFDPGNIKVISEPRPDITVQDIRTDKSSVDPNSKITVSWLVKNVGDKQTLAGWSEQVTLVAENGEQISLGSLYYDQLLGAGGVVFRQAEFIIPELPGIDGDVRVAVKLNPNPDMGELPVAQNNNIGQSDGYLTVSRNLKLELPLKAIDENNASPIRCKLLRSGSWVAEQTFTLTSSNPERLNIPANVTIPAGQSGIIFYVNLIDNDVLDMDSTVTFLVEGNGYEPVTGEIYIEDNEIPALTVRSSESELNEGDSFLLTIERQIVTNTPLLVYLNSDHPKRFEYPAQVEIPAGEKSVEVNVTAKDDNLPDVTISAEFMVTATKYTSANCIVILNDNDVPEISLSITPETVSESAGPLAIVAVLKRLSHAENNITIKLSDDSEGDLYYPNSSITLESGIEEARFTIGVIDNALVDGDREVNITAAVYISSCSCSASGTNAGVVKTKLTILDDDGPALKLTSSQNMLIEGKEDAAMLTIIRNTDTSKPLTVLLNSDRNDELVFDKEVIIPVGSVTVQVPVSVKANETTEGDRTVTFTVTAEGYTKGVCWVMITDQTLPDAVISGLTLSSSEIEAQSKVEVSVMVANKGAIPLPSQTKINLYLSNSTDVLATLYTQTAIAVGASEEVIKKVQLPNITGEFTLTAKVNEEQSVKELLYINNSSVPVTLRILPKYTAKIETDKSIYGQGEKVVIKGTVTGSAIDKVAVDIYIINSGYRKVINAITDENGSFELTYQPESWQIGHFIAGACYPDENLSNEQIAFDIYGLKRESNSYVTCQILVGEPYKGEIVLVNPGALKLTDIKAEVLSVPENCKVGFDPIASIDADGKAILKYSITGSTPTEGNNWEEIKVRITTHEGATLDLLLYYYCRSPKGQLQTSISSINTTMIKGASRDYSFTITNIGKGETGSISIALPSNASWLSLVTPKEMASLQADESATIILRMTPTDDLALNVPITGQLGINCTNGSGIPLSFSIEPVSESTGTLIVDVCDEYTYYTSKAPHLANAKVIIKHPVTGTIISEGITNVEGLFTVNDLPEGYYSIEVSAERHDTYRNNILVDPGKETISIINLSFQAITYSWDVIETEIEDEYKIVTKVDYETNVPVPVVEVVFPKELPYKNQIFNILAINKGLIAARNVTIKLPEVNGIIFTVLSDSIISSLAPQSSAMFQVQMSIDTPSLPMKAKTTREGSIVGCIAGAIGLYYMWYCGLEEKLGSQFGNYTWGECSGAFSFGGLISVERGPNSGTGPGKPTGDSNQLYGADINQGYPIIVRDCKSCESKFKQKFIDCGLGFIPGFGCGWGIGSCFNTWIDEESTDKQKIWCTLTSVAGCIPGVDSASGIVSCLVGFLDPCDRLMQVSSKLYGLKKTAIETLPSYITSFQEKIGYAVDEYKLIENVINNLFGKTEWLSCEKEELDKFYQKFIELSPLENLISRNDLQLYKPSNISNILLEEFIERWQNTYLLLSGEILPSDNYIDLDLMNSLMNKISKLEKKVQGYGYVSMSDLVTKEIILLDNKIRNEDSSNSVCASITLQFSQTMTFTRQAFDGTLTVFNGHESIAMENVKLDLVVKDTEGNIAKDDRFQINKESIDGFTGNLNEVWALDAKQTGTAKIKFIPTKFAAPDEPMEYSFGGTLSYTDPFTGLEVTRDLYPVVLTVKPSPNLELTYFMQRDVLGDDPLTKDVVEPMVPAEFSLLIHNVGKGEGKNIRMTTEQPQIIENEKGLLIDFELLSSQLNGEDKTLALDGNVTTEFGNIPAGEAVYAQWWFTSTLLGHFVDYKVEATHVTSYGNPNLSLLDKVTVHELIRSLKIPGADGKVLAGFLVNDIKDADDLPDILYLSDGTTENVSISKAAQCTANGDDKYMLTVTPTLEGWNYGIISDPTNGRQELVSVTDMSTRENIDLRNFWQTDRTLRDGKDPLQENRLHFADRFAVAAEKSYLLTFASKPNVMLEVESFIDVPTEVAVTPVTEIKVSFNKPIDASTFTTDDLTIHWQGEEQDASLIKISSTDNKVFTLDLLKVTDKHSGYFTLTVQTADITDEEGFTGKSGKTIGWNQLVGGKIRLTVKADPEEYGQIALLPKIIDNQYDFQSKVILKAEPKEGYEFVRWSRNGETLSTDAEFNYTVLSEKLIKGEFKVHLYDVVIKDGVIGGQISSNSGTGKYEYKSELSLTAIPDWNYTFEGWYVNDVLYEQNEVLNIQVNADLEIKAVFNEIPVVPEKTITFDLSSGWNWISVNVADKNLNNPVALFAPLKGDLLAVRGQENELTKEDSEELQGSLTGINPRESYKVRMQKAARLELEGSPYHSMDETITLTPAWNWIGYIPSVRQDVDDALSTLLANRNEIIKDQEGFAMYDGNRWLGSLNVLIPGCGYMYYANSTKSFNYYSGDTDSELANIYKNPINWNCDIHKYADNMNIVAKLYESSREVAKEKFVIGAFINDECRGISVEKDGYFFITIHGELLKEKIVFKAYDVEENAIYSINENSIFENAVLGNFDHPFSLTLLDPTNIENKNSNITIYPNPANINLYVRGLTENVEGIRIIDTRGNIMYVSTELSQDGINISSYTEGVYIVLITTNHGIFLEKFVKTHALSE